MITTEQVKELRDATGISVMQCRKALEEANGDMEKAVLILKKKSTDIAAKKSDRAIGAGLIALAQKNGKAATVVLGCETDFVASNEEFKAAAQKLAQTALDSGEEATKTLATTLVQELVQKIGENIQLGAITIVEGTVIGSYIHNGKSGAIVALDKGDETLAKDVAMHAAAMKPAYISEKDIPGDTKTKAEDLFKEEVDKIDKPADIKAKMLAGKIGTYFKEQTLADQPFIKDPNTTIGQLLAKSGASVTVYKLLALA